MANLAGYGQSVLTCVWESGLSGGLVLLAFSSSVYPRYSPSIRDHCAHRAHPPFVVCRPSCLYPDHAQQMDSYINLTPVTPSTIAMGQSPTRNQHGQQQQQQQQQQQILLPEQEMQRQVDEYKRSVTIIIWYKANVEPLRLQQYISTFPYFQLSTFSCLIDDLGFSPSSYLDTYVPNSHQWEQHTISTVRIVETQQRLIYKVRRSLMDGLAEAECPSLREELQMQGRGILTNNNHSHNGRGSTSPSLTAQTLASPSIVSEVDSKLGGEGGSMGDNHTKNILKRTASGPGEPRHSPKVHISGEYYIAHGSANTMVSSPGGGVPGNGASSANTPTSTLSSPNLASQPQQENVYIYQNPVFFGGNGADTSSLPPYLLTPQASAPPIPYHPHPPLKRWPNDYTVMELSNGFHSMDLLISQSPPGASMTQRAAFERVFGSRYVKSTVCRHRAVWRKAPRGLREQFEQMGTDDRACWGEFVRRVEGRAPAKAVGGGVPGGGGGGSAGGGNSGEGGVLDDYRDHQTPEDGDDVVHGQEAVMGGIHGQVQVTSNPNGNGMNNLVYDPTPHGHLSNSGQHPGHNAAHTSGHSAGHSG